MDFTVSMDRVRFYLNRLRNRLWVKPLLVCLLSIAAAFTAKFADDTGLAEFLPDIAADSVETLLSIMASSMLVIATFSVASMLSAYSSASRTATPRSFTLVVADDASQNALSTFVGAFIFSTVALTAVKNEYFETAGLFILFSLTVIVFGIVIVMFVRWVDRIARLGRMGSTIEKVENATARALEQRKKFPTLCGMPVTNSHEHKQTVFATSVGYVQHIDIAALQTWAEKVKVRVVVAALPGALVAPGQALAHIKADGKNELSGIDFEGVIKSFEIGNCRVFEDDPRFGLVVLSEIASRALSPAVNDPGTAISIIGTLLRLFTLWHKVEASEKDHAPRHERIEVPEIQINDMFDDAFTAIARDGAGMVEVAVRLQKALLSLAAIDDENIQEAAKHHGRLALKRSQIALNVEEDFTTVQEVANKFITSNN